MLASLAQLTSSVCLVLLSSKVLQHDAALACSSPTTQAALRRYRLARTRSRATPALRKPRLVRARFKYYPKGDIRRYYGRNPYWLTSRKVKDNDADTSEQSSTDV